MLQILEQLSFWSLIDIFIIAGFLYYFSLIIKGTRTAQILSGLLFFVIVYILSSNFPLNTVHWLLEKFYSSFFLILVILFQDDIRKTLQKLGLKNVFPNFDNQNSQPFLEELAFAVFTLSSRKIGALILLERAIILSRYSHLGIILNANLSKTLLEAIFQPNSPIHDGAVILQGTKILAAGCFLPLSKNEKLAFTLGTRHRAAIGITEETDAIAIIASEETGSVCLGFNGQLIPVSSPEELIANITEIYRENSPLISNKLIQLHKRKES